jgi:hypothetical protein
MITLIEREREGRQGLTILILSGQAALCRVKDCLHLSWLDLLAWEGQGHELLSKVGENNSPGWNANMVTGEAQGPVSLAQRSGCRRAVAVLDRGEGSPVAVVLLADLAVVAGRAHRGALLSLHGGAGDLR